MLQPWERLGTSVEILVYMVILLYNVHKDFLKV